MGVIGWLIEWIARGVDGVITAVVDKDYIATDEWRLVYAVLLLALLVFGYVLIFHQPVRPLGR